MTDTKTTLFTESSKGSSETYVVVTAFLSLFAIVGIAYYGLPFFFDFMAKDFGWTRTTITSGNALGKLLIGSLFGFITGWLIDRYGPRRLSAPYRKMTTGSKVFGGNTGMIKWLMVNG